jgi:protein-S-isoprenylcysteine O-methyltransferase Ste14
VLITILGILIFIGFFFMEFTLRSGGEAKSWQAGQSDQSSTMFIMLAYVVCALALISSSFLDKLNIASFPIWIGWLGIAIALIGFGLRIWSMRVLGKFYTRTLKVTENQSIVRAGPYRFIRHPGYLGSILIWSGVATSTTDWIVLLIVLIVIFGVYIYRIQSEEKMLLATNANYVDYRNKTWRLIPLLY